MKDILLVAPTSLVYENSLKAVKENSFSNIEVVDGVLNDGLCKANEFIINGGKIIISRGGTYDLIKKSVSVPVVEIKVNTVDCIAAYNKLCDNEENIGVIGFKNVIYGFEALSTICKRKFYFKEITDEKEIPKVVKECKESGITKIVGDVLVKKVTKELECDGVLVDSTVESIAMAMREAYRILEASRYQLKRNFRIQTVMDSVRDILIYTDGVGNIKLMNKTAEKLIGPMIKGINIRKIIPSVSNLGEGVRGKIYAINGVKYLVNIVPVYMENKLEGTVFSMQLCDEISSLEYSVRRSMHESGFVARYNFDDIVHKSKLIDQTIETAKKFAVVDSPILINGKSGTGKELMCQSIHNWSNRKNQPFVAVNCAAIAPSLIESEFFGYSAGAFTGAKKSGKPGIFELAHNGTLFLDEISELPMELQGRLLRVLQEKEVMRLGGDKLIPIDVRVVCASNKNLRQMVEKGEFRTDLYFRISILKLNIPKLEDRREDIIPLAEFFIDIYSKKYNTDRLHIGEMERDLLNRRKYDGNVRELEGLIEESTVLGSFDNFVDSDKTAISYEPLIQKNVIPSETLLEHSDKYIMEVYNSTCKNIKMTCDILGISRSTLWRKLNDVSK